ncbi:MAG: winged helix DNA-binding domain-containing protein [Acidobacteria bacterium]|nr:winged helix DNA-binding domain-containing protein [Acidobacteriota bacterium]
MDESKLRAWRWHRQGLDGALAGAKPSEVLERAGWARSVGGVGPYLTLFSRAGTSRAQTDQAVASLSIHELPAARGCTYVVPASEFALALAVGRQFGDGEMKVAAKLGVTENEIEKLCDAAMRSLAKKPLTPEEIRQATGDASRSLGEEGKKKGLTTTLPIALGRLQAAGDIRRVAVGGRLDQQRYAYAAWRPNPLAKFRLSAEEAFTELARRYFRWVAPATLGEFQWFAGLTGKAARASVEPLNLVPVEAGDARLMFEDDREAFAKFKPPKKPQYTLVSSLDSIHAHRRDARSLLDGGDLKRQIIGSLAGQPGGGLTDLPSHAILDRGRLVGLWEFDAESQSIAWSSFAPKDKQLHAAVARTEAFVRDQLGDARSFSLDTPKSRAPRIEALRRQHAAA